MSGPTIHVEGPAARPRCAELARIAGLNPVASVAGVSGVLLVEWPLPWPRDASDIEALAPVVERIGALASLGEHHRLQLVCPAVGATDAATRRVIRWFRSAGAFERFESTELVVGSDDVVGAALSLLEGTPSSPGATAALPADVLVCGHGSRDVCCGSSGTALARRLDGGRARIWRTSHLGGHRFAPTAAVLPGGQVWGHLDAEVAQRIMAEELSPAQIRRHFRGTLGISGGAAQVVEREALCTIGWQWTHYRREVEAFREVARAVWHVRMAFEDLEGRPGLVTARVRHDGDVAIPGCRGQGDIVDYPRWAVDGFRIEPNLRGVHLT